MCGIAGVYNRASGAPVEPSLIRAMTDTIAHRGPDDEGFHHDAGGALALGFRRLSIVDLVTGHQPLATAGGTHWIVYNGEVYNHAELRRELEARGCAYRSRSDTESIAYAYRTWGPSCVERLRGMFAFAIWDAGARTLFCARDRLGIKPLYYTEVNGDFLFASEIKALLRDPRVERRVDPQALADFVTHRYVPGPLTLFAGIHKLPPGHTLTVTPDRGPVVRRYWDVSYRDKLTLPYAAACDELEARLTESVRLRLMSDVPLGALLSGGVDSSLVVALMSRLVSTPVRTFSVGFDAPGPYSELPHARTVARHLGTDHHEIVVDARALSEGLEAMAWHQDEPVTEPAAVPTFFVSQLARRHVTVVLTGEGGDESFAGYPKYAYSRLYPWYRKLPAALRRRVIPPLVASLPFGFRRAKVLERSFRIDDEAERLASWFAGLSPDEKRGILTPEFAAQVGDPAGTRMIAALLPPGTNGSELDRMLYVDTKVWLPDDLLMKLDKMSMATSIEGRVPLLDHQLVEWAARLPAAYKVRGLTGKRILKDVARRHVPAEVIDRRKVGFTVPIGPWFRGPLRPLLEDALLSERARRRGVFEPARVRQLVSEHVEGRVDRQRELWMLLALELWFRTFVDPARLEAPVALPRV